MMNFNFLKKTIFEKRENGTYTKIDYSNALKTEEEKEKRGIKPKWDFSSEKSRTYENIPDHKIFDFLRKAFENSPWRKIKRFKTNWGREFHVDELIWDYQKCGYVLNLKIHYHYDPDDLEKISERIITVQDINCLEPYGGEIFDIEKEKITILE